MAGGSVMYQRLSLMEIRSRHSELFVIMQVSAVEGYPLGGGSTVHVVAWFGASLSSQCDQHSLASLLALSIFTSLISFSMQLFPMHNELCLSYAFFY